MKLVAYCFLQILLSGVIFGCKPSASVRMFDSIESAIAENPDSALSMLDTLDTALLLSAKDNARYHLLMAEARYKAGYDDTVTNFVTPAVDYYKDHGPRHDASRAHFYSGLVRYNQKRYASAAVDLLRAERIAQEDKDTLQLAFIYRAMGDNLYKAKDYRSSLSYYKKSYKYFKKTKKDIYAIHAIYDMARCYLPLGYYSQVVKYALIFYNYGNERNDSSMKAYGLGMLGSGYYYMGNYSNSLKSYNEMLKYGQDYFSDNDYYMLGSSLFYLGDIAESRKIQAILSSLDSIPSMLHFRLLLHDGKFKEAVDVLNANLDWQNAEINHVWSTNLAAEVISYEQSEELLIQQSRKKERFLWVIIITLGGIIVAIIGVYIFKKNKYLIKERDASMAEIDNLSRTLHSIDVIHTEKEKQHCMEVIKLRDTITYSHYAIKELLSSQFSTLSDLCQTYFQHENNKSAQGKVYEKVKELVLRVSSDKQFKIDLERTVNRSLNNLMSNFRKDFPNLNEWEYTLFLLNVCSIEPKTVALLLGERPDLIYKRKANLKRKISNSVSPIKDEYLSFF